VAAVLDDALALAAGRQHLDDGLAHGRREELIGGALWRDVARQREAREARVHHEEVVLRAQPLADAFHLVHRDRGQGQRLGIGVDR
jgi:hypothetical protein